jgi:hypothetical protein
MIEGSGFGSRAGSGSIPLTSGSGSGSATLPCGQVAMTDKRTLQDPERQRLVQQQIMMNYQVQPSQVKEKNKSRVP